MKTQKLKNLPKAQKYTPHELYLRNEKWHKIKIKIWQFGILLFFIALWEIATIFGWIDSFFTSSPSRILTSFISLLGDNLWYHIGITLLECLIGFTISTLLGVLVAVVLWLFVSTREVIQPYLIVLNALPKIALGPLIILWVGSGAQAIIFMAVLICIIVTIMSTLDGLLATDKNKLLLLRSMGASKYKQLLYVVLPSALPTLMSVIKVNIGLAWVGTIMGEYLNSSAGLGYLIIYGGQVFKIDLVMTSTVLLCILAALMYVVVAFIEKRVIKK